MTSVTNKQRHAIVFVAVTRFTLRTVWYYIYVTWLQLFYITCAADEQPYQEVE